MIAIGDFHINPIQLEDAWNICNFAISNEDRLALYFPSTLAQNLTPTLSKRFTEKKVKQFNSKEEFLFTIKPNESNEIAGLVYIKELDWDKKQGEFAYAVAYRFEGKGLISKAVDALSKYAFDKLELQTLQIISNKNNLASVKVALNCGYTWQRTLVKEFTPTNGEPLDMELYEKTCEVLKTL